MRRRCLHLVSVLLLIASTLAGCSGGGGGTGAQIGTANGGVDLDVKTPASLVFKVQPTNVRAFHAFNPVVTVQALQGNGTPMTDATGNVTIQMGNNPGGGSVHGTLVVGLQNGEAAFPDLTIDKGGNGYTLVATLLTIKNTTLGVTSQSFNVTGAPPPGNLGRISWQAIGPAPAIAAPPPTGDQENTRVSGRATAIIPNGQTIFLGTAGGGLWKSTNGGASWSPLTDAQTFSAIGCLALDPNNPARIFVGTGESNDSGDAKYGDGLYVTGDGGATFTKLGGTTFNRTAISSVVVSRQTSNTIFVGTAFPAGLNFSTDFDYGVWRSTDGGQTFSNVTHASFGGRGSVSSVIAVPSTVNGNPDILFAGVDGSIGGHGGVYTSVDNGTTWTKVTTGLPGTNGTGRVLLAGAPSNADVIYAAIGDSNGDTFNGLFASNDRGQTWAKITLVGFVNSIQQAVDAQSNYNLALAVDPNDSASVFIGLIQGFRVSGIDFGTTSGNVTLLGVPGDRHSDPTHPHVDQHAYMFGPNPDNPASPPSLYAACDGGIWRLDNPLAAGQATAWNNLNGDNLATLQYYGVAAAGHSAQALGGTQDNGTAWFTGSVLWQGILGGDGGYCFIDQQDDQVAAFSSQADTTGLSIAESFGGNYGDINSWGIFLGQGATGVDLSDFDTTLGQVNFFTPFVLHRGDPNRTAALGTFRVWETTENDLNGIAWTPSETLLDRNQDYITALDYGIDQGTLYVVSFGGHAFVRKQVGAAFTEVTGNIPTVVSQFSSVAVDRSDASGNTAYIGVNSFTDGQGGLVFRTTNGGDSWTDITSNLPDIPVDALIVDPNGTVFAGTDSGIYGLTSDSATWQPIDLNLPASVSVYAFDVSETQGRIIAGTHGRSVYSSPLSGDATTQGAKPAAPRAGKLSPARAKSDWPSNIPHKARK